MCGGHLHVDRVCIFLVVVSFWCWCVCVLGVRVVLVCVCAGGTPNRCGIQPLPPTHTHRNTHTQAICNSVIVWYRALPHIITWKETSTPVDIGPFLGGKCGIAMHHMLRPYTILLQYYKYYVHIEYRSLFTRYRAFVVEYVAMRCNVIFHQKSPISREKRPILHETRNMSHEPSPLHE